MHVTKIFLAIVALGGSAVIDAQPRTIEFGEQQWTVRSSAGPTAPGNNTFSDSETALWIDNEGGLHMTVGEYATEIRSRRPLGYGTYETRTVARLDQLDRNVVFGFFTFELPSTHEFHREIDIEFSRWGNSSMTNAQFSVQPSSVQQNRHRFELAQTGTATTHRFVWTPGHVDFVSWHGHGEYPPTEELVAARFSVRGSQVPEPGRARIYFNFWRYEGKPLDSIEREEIVISDFSFMPLVQ